MNIPDKEFSILERSCDLLELRLEDQFRDLAGGKISTLDRDGGCQAEDLVRMMDASISRLQMDRNTEIKSAGSNSKIESNVALIQARCRRLLALIERNAKRCHGMQAAADAALRSLRSGGRFLRCMRAYDDRQPRFVDSRH